MREMAFLKDLYDFSILHRFSLDKMFPNSDFFEKTFPKISTFWVLQYFFPRILFLVRNDWSLSKKNQEVYSTTILKYETIISCFHFCPVGISAFDAI